MSEQPTICTNCRHLIRKEPPSSPRYNVWYNFLCGAVENEKKLNFQTGLVEYPDQKHPNCKAINPDGKCKYFKQRSFLDVVGA